MDKNKRAIPWDNTIKENIFNPKFFKLDYNAEAIHRSLTLIPPDAKVCASTSILPQLAMRPYAYEFPDVEDAEYLAIFVFKDYFDISALEYEDDIFKYVTNPSWKVIANNYPFLLLKRTSFESNLPPAKSRDFDSLECTANKMNRIKTRLVASDGELLNSTNTRDTVFRHNSNYTVHLMKDRHYGFSYESNFFNPGDSIFVSVWKYPAHKDNGYLVVSSGNIYLAQGIGIQSDNFGWTKLTKWIIIPKNHNELRVCV